MTIVDDPVLTELKKIVSAWPSALYEEVVHTYPQKSVGVGTARFPTSPNSAVVLSVVAYAGDSYNICIECKKTGEVVWSEIWEMSMKYLPDGTRIESPSSFAKFGSERISLLLFSEWILLIQYGWITREKVLIVRTGRNWRAESSRKWIGSRLLVRDQTAVYYHSPSQQTNRPDHKP